MFSSGFLSGSGWLGCSFFCLWFLFNVFYCIFSTRVSNYSRPIFCAFVGSPVFSVGQLLVRLVMFFDSAFFYIYITFLLCEWKCPCLKIFSADFLCVRVYFGYLCWLCCCFYYGLLLPLYNVFPAWLEISLSNTPTRDFMCSPSGFPPRTCRLGRCPFQVHGNYRRKCVLPAGTTNHIREIPGHLCSDNHERKTWCLTVWLNLSLVPCCVALCCVLAYLFTGVLLQSFCSYESWRLDLLVHMCYGVKWTDFCVAVRPCNCRYLKWAFDELLWCSCGGLRWECVLWVRFKVDVTWVMCVKLSCVLIWG